MTVKTKKKNITAEKNSSWYAGDHSLIYSLMSTCEHTWTHANTNMFILCTWSPHTHFPLYFSPVFQLILLGKLTAAQWCVSFQSFSSGQYRQTHTWVKRRDSQAVNFWNTVTVFPHHLIQKQRLNFSNYLIFPPLFSGCRFPGELSCIKKVLLLKFKNFEQFFH